MSEHDKCIMARVEKISGTQGKNFIREHHYSGGCHNGPMAWGLFTNNDLVGVCAFATPCSENVRASLFGPCQKNSVTELHRLVVLDEGRSYVKTSWFVSRAIKGLLKYKPYIRGIISFADSTEGHDGGIYRSLNFLYCGTTGSSTTFYRDENGRLRHPRQSGKNISIDDAAKKGWVPERRGEKHRYVLLTGNTRAERAWAKANFLLTPTRFNGDPGD